MPIRKLLVLVLFATLVLSCTIPSIMLNPSVSYNSHPVIIMAPADATATPTPFQPIPPTVVYLPTDLPTPITPTLYPTEEPQVSEAVAKSWADYPGPSVWPDIEVPAPVGLLAQPEGQINILLLGSDQRPYTGGFRTDTILLATLNPKQGIVSLTSFPRDLYVYIPGWTVQRINTAFGYGGFDSLALTMEYNFGVHPDYYVLVNFWVFEQVIDNLGGIDVNVAVPHTDHRDDHGDYSVPAGIVYMDGETALWYVRSRYTTSDFDRGRRQQEVLEAIFERVMSLDAVGRAPELYNLYVQNVTTDLSLEAVTPLLPLATQLNDTSRIHRYAIGPAQVMNWVNTQGAQVLLPIREAVVEVMKQALNSP